MAALIADVLPRLRELDIVLASTSPRRAEILRAMGLPFTQRAPPFEEALEHRRFASPAHYVAANAWGKALSILAEPAEPAEHGEKAGRGTVIVASDTVVALHLDDVASGQGGEAATAGPTTTGNSADAAAAPTTASAAAGADDAAPAATAAAGAEDAATSASWMKGFPMCGLARSAEAGGGSDAHRGAWVVLEKPGSADRAVEMLKALRGKSHFVFTAVAVAFRGQGSDGASLAEESLAAAATALGLGERLPGWEGASSAGPGLCLGTTTVPAAVMEGSPAAHTTVAAAGGAGAGGSASGAGCCVCVQSSRVELVNFSDAAAEAYAAGGEPLDKAGGYAVQGAGGSLVRSLEGDFHAVMGLPMALTAAMLRPAAAQAGGRGCGGE
ncbi:hypothetical protein FNF31_06589 [Cafeteria roenbergensis]|uniref:Septum formation protein Maf n=1 Tax=Cafeteria roenbergensis TaxID=33653 RepID=A0A5A8CJL1_CAFRO|nr:hypothetical protein FNF31_06589 [Cafeteria roenbergensis]